MEKLSRKDAREARKQAKLDKLNRRKMQIDTEVVKQPLTVVHLSEQDKRPKSDTSIDQLLSKDQQLAKAANTGRFELSMTWCARIADQEGEWSWREPRKWAEKEWEDDIIQTLDHLQGKTWSEIDDFSSGTGHKMHHGHEVSDLCKEARRRWKGLGYEEFDVFRFRTGSKRRAWGIPLHGHFYLIWFERGHKIYPVGT